MEIKGNMDDSHVHVEKQHCRFYEQEFPKIDEVVMVEVGFTSSPPTYLDSSLQKTPDPRPRTGHSASLTALSCAYWRSHRVCKISRGTVDFTISGAEQLPSLGCLVDS